jgi:hypothetical protein
MKTRLAAAKINHAASSMNHISCVSIITDEAAERWLDLMMGYTFVLASSIRTCSSL